jgi:precorrin isomerase
MKYRFHNENEKELVLEKLRNRYWELVNKIKIYTKCNTMITEQVFISDINQAKADKALKELREVSNDITMISQGVYDNQSEDPENEYLNLAR